MAVRVRMFAALREAAREEVTTSGGATVPEVLEDLRSRYGEPFGSRLQIATVLVDGDQVSRTGTRPLPEGAEVVLLPPVSGGARGRAGL
jgi:molybdopterin converting factor small subunit